MPKGATVEPEAPKVESTPEQDAEKRGHLTKAYEEAQSKLAEIASELTAAVAGGADVKTMVAISGRLSAAQAEVTKAHEKVKGAEYALKAQERSDFKEALANAVRTFLDSVDGTKARELSIAGFAVTFADDATSIVVNEKVIVGAKTGKVGRPKSEGIKSTGQGAGGWNFNGETYSSRSLLESFGGERGAIAIDRATNWKEPRWGPNGDTPMSAGPGFDAPVKVLARTMGWDGGDSHQLIHLPQ